MEHCRLLHLPFAKGRIENELPPAPKKVKRPFYTRWWEAVKVLKGDAIAVNCYDDMDPPEGEVYK